MKKRLLDYVLRELITNLKICRLYNSEYYRGIFLEIQKIVEVGKEHMKVQEETVKKVI